MKSKKLEGQGNVFACFYLLNFISVVTWDRILPETAVADNWGKCMVMYIQNKRIMKIIMAFCSWVFRKVLSSTISKT